MILSDKEIWMEIQSRQLVFDPPIEPEQVHTSSVDLRLSDQFTVLTPPPQGAEIRIDLAEGNAETIAKRFGKTETIPKDGEFSFKPDTFVLAYTLEYVMLPNYLAARVEGRSSLARYGISIHKTAPTVHATFQGQLRLELTNEGPFTCVLRPGQIICQLIIERLGSPSNSTLNSTWQQQRQN